MNDFDESYDWPGWSLKDNPFGMEFNYNARRRMVEGSRILLPMIKKYHHGEIMLEAGPFFNPLLRPEEFSNVKSIIFMDNDPYVIDYLGKKYYGYDKIKIIKTDLSFLKVKDITMGVDSITASHILNYIDYKMFLRKCLRLLKKGGFLFINHSVNYGLPFFFSKKRPKSIEDLIQELKTTGFCIVEDVRFKSENLEHQQNDRVLIVAKKVS